MVALLVNLPQWLETWGNLSSKLDCLSTTCTNHTVWNSCYFRRKNRGLLLSRYRVNYNFLFIGISLLSRKISKRLSRIMSIIFFARVPIVVVNDFSFLKCSQIVRHEKNNKLSLERLDFEKQPIAISYIIRQDAQCLSRFPRQWNRSVLCLSMFHVNVLSFSPLLHSVSFCCAHYRITNLTGGSTKDFQ